MSLILIKISHLTFHVRCSDARVWYFPKFKFSFQLITDWIRFNTTFALISFLTNKIFYVFNNRNSNTQSLRNRKCVKLLKKSYRKSDLPCRDKGNQEFPPQPQQQISKISSQRTEKTEKHIKGYRLTMHNKPNSSSLPQLISFSMT